MHLATTGNDIYNGRGMGHSMQLRQVITATWGSLAISMQPVFTYVEGMQHVQ
jgi:hypothetical protein